MSRCYIKQQSLILYALDVVEDGS